jgi:D-serine deaminase-like pyridoxal phosphate-dependent protein
MVVMVGGKPERLIPHVKTHKMPEIVRMQLEVGITKFKCATIAEAEMIAEAGACWILIAYQLVGPNINRLQALRAKYPSVQFTSLIDSLTAAISLNDACQVEPCGVFLDVNNGMDRSGHAVNAGLMDLYEQVTALPKVNIIGLHVYDGHICDNHFNERKNRSDAAFEPVLRFRDQLIEKGFQDLMIIAGGSPTFTVHAIRNDVYCSPGTSVLWDWGYGDRFLDQPFQNAALIATRVISKPTPGIITIDLGHKAIAAENPIEKRFRFLNLWDYEVLNQSEEHGVIKVKHHNMIKVGDLLYALPYHICPTVALHESALVVENQTVLDEWQITARKRKITI